MVFIAIIEKSICGYKSVKMVLEKLNVIRNTEIIRYGESVLEKFGSEMKNLIRRLLENIPLYFDRNLTLNSDGRRLLSQLLRYLLYEHQEYRYLAREIRKNPTIENVIKLARIILSSDEISEILDIQLKGPYKYSIDSMDQK